MSVQAGIAGLGRWGRRLTESIETSSVIQFTAGCTGRRAHAVDYCSEKGIDLRDSLDDLLNDPVIDAIILATPHTQHAEQIIASAKAGKHVFVEKPFTMSRESAERAATAVLAADVVCGLGHNRRFLPAMQRMRNIISSGEIGTPLHVEANISVPSSLREAEDNWRQDPIESPAGGMTSLGVHMTDALISMLGPVAEVCATSEKRILIGPIDDVTFMTMRFANGTTGYMSTILSTARIWFIRIMGSEGWASMQGYQQIAVKRLDQDDGEERLETFERVNSEKLELEAFADAIMGGSEYLIRLEEAVHGAELLEAIVQSAITRSSVML
ncbi:MAG: hypothetical protein CBB68_10565 [Rhodospirillaceae bacterium TMED8]|nr:oxidoreductase [Magnetovibrio sp.]OUT49855.1 MAG: hypothetical protein CBB68_10565 [Rhodospirillaceae bacterium TMED8]